MKTKIATVIMTAGIISVAATSCRPSASTEKVADNSAVRVVEKARFDGDSAYAYVARQVAMGPRVPGSRANEMCSDFIVASMERFGAENIRRQKGSVTAYNGDVLPITNIMASINPEASRRVLLLAHYDTRPWADSDPVTDNRNRPVPGANDGASGVGVLLEVARQLGQEPPTVGVDFLFVDAEDYGQSAGFSNHDESWALGTQYWIENMPYALDSLPDYAILLDMVGGVGAKFHREYFSNESAPQIVDKVWRVAEASGYGERFVNVLGGAVIDDHVYVNKAGIPAIDIIESKNQTTKTFPSTWHTVNDDMDNIDRATLKAAGQTVLNVIYSE